MIADFVGQILDLVLLLSQNHSVWFVISLRPGQSKSLHPYCADNRKQIAKRLSARVRPDHAEILRLCRQDERYRLHLERSKLGVLQIFLDKADKLGWHSHSLKRRNRRCMLVLCVQPKLAVLFFKVQHDLILLLEHLSETTRHLFIDLWNLPLFTWFRLHLK